MPWRGLIVFTLFVVLVGYAVNRLTTFGKRYEIAAMPDGSIHRGQVQRTS